MQTRICLWVGLLLGLFAIQPAFGCKVPVFKYALDNSPAEMYHLTVFSRGALAPAQQALVDSLQASTNQPSPNIATAVNDVAHAADAANNPLWLAQQAPQLPWMVVQYPYSFSARTGGGVGADVLWAGALQKDTIRRLCDSPAKRELVRRLLRGDSIVWLLLEGDNPAENAKIASFLQTELQQLEHTVKASAEDTAEPKAATPAPAADPATTDATENVPIAFSIQTLSRKDPAEEFFVAQLLTLRMGLDEVKGPIVFPVFGRARVLEALDGKAINKESLAQKAAFLCGDCSCTIKAQNPGVDLLVTALWPAAKPGVDALAQSTGLPSMGELVTPPPPYLRARVAQLTSQVQQPPSNHASMVANITTNTPVRKQPAPDPVRRNLLIAILSVVALVVGGTSWILLRKG